MNVINVLKCHSYVLSKRMDTLDRNEMCNCFDNLNIETNCWSDKRSALNKSRHE